MGRFSNFWYLSERERKGYIFLLMLILLIMAAPWAYRQFLRKENPVKPSLALLDSLRRSTVDRGYSSTYHPAPRRSSYTKKEEGSLFFFNPNQLPVERWRALGFSDKQIAVIKNYEKKGGHFRNKADLAKIYSISDKQFQRIAPYLLFDSINSGHIVYKAVAPKAYTEKSTSIRIDVNRADTSDLKKLPGIGSVFSKRIVTFRDRLGGFYSIDQLAEVYGLSPELLSAIQQQLFVDATFPIQKIAFNEATVDDLLKHPYINRKTAMLLIRYRDQHRPVNAIADLENILALPEGFLHKIAPYLRFN